MEDLSIRYINIGILESGVNVNGRYRWIAVREGKLAMWFDLVGLSRARWI